MNKIVSTLGVIFVIGLLFVSYCFGALKEKNKYRLPVHSEFIADYNIKALEQMFEALEFAYIAGQIAEARVCPCYDIVVSSKTGNPFLRVDRSNCPKEDEDE